MVAAVKAAVSSGPVSSVAGPASFCSQDVVAPTRQVLEDAAKAVEASGTSSDMSAGAGGTTEPSASDYETLGVGVGNESVSGGSLERRGFILGNAGSSPIVIDVTPRVTVINPPMPLKATLKQYRHDRRTGEVLFPEGGLGEVEETRKREIDKRCRNFG